MSSGSERISEAGFHGGYIKNVFMRVQPCFSRYLDAVEKVNISCC